MMALMLDPAVGTLLVACFALLFASAAAHKLRDLRHFTEVLAAYHVLPAGGERLAPLVAVLELTVAVGLLATPVRAPATLAAVTVLLAYAAAIAMNLARGRRDLDCGCGVPGTSHPIAPWMVVRNLLLALLLAVSLIPWENRQLLPTDALTVGAGLAVATLLYGSLDRLLGRLNARTALMRGPR